MDETGLCLAGTDNSVALRVITLIFNQSCLARHQQASVGIRAAGTPIRCADYSDESLSRALNLFVAASSRTCFRNSTEDATRKIASRSIPRRFYTVWAGSARTTCCHKADFGGNCQRGERQLIGTDGNSHSRPRTASGVFFPKLPLAG